MQETVHYWMAATEISERARYARSPSGLERAVGSNGSDQAAPLGLALALSRQGQFREAWRRWESSLARGVLDDFSARRLRPLTVQERQHESDLVGQLQQLDERIGRLVAKSGRTQAEDQRLEELSRERDEIHGRFVAFENELEGRYQAFAGHPAGLAEVQDALPHDAALVGGSISAARVRLIRRSVSVTGPASSARRESRSGSRSKGPGRRGPGPGGRDRPAALCTALSDATMASWRDLAATLARQRLEPLRPHLEGVRHLIVLPSADLAGIPVEALVAAWPGGATGSWSAMRRRVDVRRCVSRGQRVEPARRSSWPWAIPPTRPPRRNRRPRRRPIGVSPSSPSCPTARPTCSGSSPATCCWSTTAPSSRPPPT